MNTVQKLDFLKMRILHAQLAKFGLNPSDWKINHAKRKARGADLEMHHCQDADFRFKAQLERTASGRSYLKNLTLISV